MVKTTWHLQKKCIIVKKPRCKQRGFLTRLNCYFDSLDFSLIFASFPFLSLM